MFKVIASVFSWVFKIVFFPLWLIRFVVKAPARKKNKQSSLEKWSCDANKAQREQQERREREQREADEYFDKYYR